ncbi:tail fiber protein [Pectobacterium phage MA13]|uniref:Tail fiber protein n=1 Tax=Pectobacterium phage MA13 TaxID=2662284 RepID=A0A5Q2F5J8_9CAUD|nr:tail fiber protein [Pectobacterium phage MA13]
MKVDGSYESVVRGVSEQTPSERRSGQMWEQVNMISDPVRGAVRRHGSEYKSHLLLKDQEPALADLKRAASASTVKSYDCDGRELDIIYRHRSGDTVIGTPIHAYDKTQGKFLNVQAQGEIWDAIRNNGVNGMVNIGRFLYIGATGYTTKFRVESRMPGANEPKKGVVWIRQGNFSRTYKLQIIFADGRVDYVEFKTPPASYPKALDTSDIPMPEVPTNPKPGEPWEGPNPGDLQDYQKKLTEYNKAVSERTQEYNSAVTSWIGESTAQIQPEYIAGKLEEALAAIVTVKESIWHEGNYLTVDERALIADIMLFDGGDDTYMRSLFDTVDSPDKLSPRHYPGKVMRISAKKQSKKDSYFMEAFPKLATGGGAITEVVWRECAGEATVPELMFAVAWADTNTLYIGSTPEQLNAMAPEAKSPLYERSSVGDKYSSPAPMFFGKVIDYMGVHQDRLVVASGAVTFASRPGDYFNWFRQTVLSVEDNDPVEMYALGGEDDTIYWDATFDRNLVLFGRKYQYVLPGRTMLSPKNPTIQIMSANEDAVKAEPKASGSFVFFSQDNATKGSLHQIQLGSVTDSSDAYEVSQTLDKYIKGNPTQILCMRAPNNVFMRSSDNTNGFYVYTYLDSMQGGERLFDSWSRWEWNAKLGVSCGISTYKGDLLSYTWRNSNGKLWIVCDMFNLDTEVSGTAYLDSKRKAGTIPEWWSDSLTADAFIVYNESHQYYMLGVTLPKVEEYMADWQNDIEHLTVGVGYDAYVVPTSPYLRDRNDKAITTGRLTVSSMVVNVTDTGGLKADLETRDRTTQALNFEGRLLSRKSNLVGRSPIMDTSVKVPVFKEIRDYKVYLRAQKWLPLNISGLEWVGQWFNNVKRV